MAKKILELLRETAAEVVLDTTGAIGNQLKYDAVDAIMFGVDSPQWEKYMRHFAENKEQLARLTLNDDMQENSDVRSSCAYIVANAVCGTQTGTQTYKLVNSVIDAGIPLPGTPLT
jgi:hypothetical protein